MLRQDLIFDLNKIEEDANSLGFTVFKKEIDLISIKIEQDWYLSFGNEGDNDTIIFFENGNEWHCHGSQFENDCSIKLVPLNILHEIKNGKLLLVEEVSKRNNFQPIKSFNSIEELMGDLKYLEKNESILIKRF